jgi:hypothetical protein
MAVVVEQLLLGNAVVNQVDHSPGMGSEDLIEALDPDFGISHE